MATKLAIVEGGDEVKKSKAARLRALLTQPDLAFIMEAHNGLSARIVDAKKELEQAIALRPRQYNAYYKLYQVAIELGEEREARQALAEFEAWKARAGR